MRILFYAPNFWPEKTGTGKYTGEMASWLAAQGHEVEALVGPPHYPEWRVHDGYSNRKQKQVWMGVHIQRAAMFVPPAAAVTTKNRIRMESSFSFHASRFWIKRFFGSKNLPDVVIAVSPPMQVAVFPSLLQTFRGVPWVFHVQDLQVDAAFRLGMLKSGLLERLLFRMENRYLRKASRVSTITEAMRRRIVTKGLALEKTWLVPNWTDLDFIVPSPHENDFRNLVGAGASDVLCIYAGNLGKKQGLDVLIQAAKSLMPDRTLKFVIVGSGADELRLRQLAKDQGVANLQFLPLQTLEGLPQMLAAADIHLVIQKREAADLVMPSKLTNILAAGRCSIATADPGTTLHQVLIENDCGVVTPVDDVSALVQAIQAVARDPAERSRMGRNARAYAEKHLGKDSILGEFESRLLALIKEKT